MKRPLPALIALLALLFLTALVWWRVLNRDSGGNQAAGCPTETHSAAATLPGPSLITLRVLNATDRTGIARKARTTLIADGFNVPDAASNDGPKVKVPGVAEIRYGPSGRSAAMLVRYYFPGARMVPGTSKSTIVIVSLGERYRGIASASAVQAQLQRQQIGLDTTTPGAPSPSPSC